jgi:hypothetical protein
MLIFQSWHDLCNKEVETNILAATQGQSSPLVKDSIMKSKYLENGLALLGALVILIGVSAAASSALAVDVGTVEIHGSAQN